MTKKKDKKAATGAAVVKGKLKIKEGKAAEVVSSELAFAVPLFKVFTDQVLEAGAEKPVRRDIVRHNGSVVILAVDDSKSKKDPLIVIERQYRHAAGQYLYEVPAGKVDEGEDRLAAAKREFLEETGMMVAGEFVDLGVHEQPSGKTIAAWACEGDFDPATLKSNRFAIEWPPRSGRMAEFPEVDRAAWYSIEEALEKINKGQKPIVTALKASASP